MGRGLSYIYLTLTLAIVLSMKQLLQIPNPSYSTFYETATSCQIPNPNNTSHIHYLEISTLLSRNSLALITIENGSNFIRYKYSNK